MVAKKATSQEIQEFIEKYKAWSVQNEKLHREYVFSDFCQAFGFMTEIALFAEGINHHPEWLNVYNRLVVELCTHEIDAISDLDFRLAEKMEKTAEAKLRPKA